MKYEPIIGMEVHAELKTKSKMFCSCRNDFGFEKEPNVDICPVCSGQPGTLPVINEEAVRMVIKTGLALNANVPENSKFDRKNYFYPDLPKGYQISQYDQPLSEGGYLDLSNNGQINRIRITRVHLEEDTGKLTHPTGAGPAKSPNGDNGAGYSLVDLNRAGVPLMELVTEPDIHSGAQAKKFCQELQLILRYLGVSDADMEKGQMRCEVNISLREIAEQRGNGTRNNAENKLGTKVEIKNLNSFRVVEKAIDYEIKRQTKVLEESKKVIQETRGWDEAKGITVSQRTKEEAHDYRYFPEPDLPPLETKEILKNIGPLPELPNAKRKRFAVEYGLPDQDVEVLVYRPETSDYFEKSMTELDDWAKDAEPKIEPKKLRKLAVNYLITELQKLMARGGVDFSELKITPEDFAEFIKVVAQGVVSSSGAQTVLAEMFRTGEDPSRIIKEKDLGQVSDKEELNMAVAEALIANPGPVAEYKKGKQNSLMFLVGKIMAATKGKANPQVVIELLKKRLTE